MTRICEACGAASRHACEMEDDLGCCPWEEQGGWDELDPDRLREDRDDMRTYPEVAHD